jgi:hypothetical protein
MDLQGNCSQPNCADGSGPENDSLVVSDDWRIYGTAFEGGLNKAGCLNLVGLTNGCSVVFELSPNADKTAWTERVVYAFCQKGGANCTDGGIVNLSVAGPKEGDFS